MTNKEIKQFTKDMLKIASQQSDKISANKKEIKTLTKIINNRKNPLIKEVERVLDNRNRLCRITAVLSESNNLLSKEEANKKLNDFNQKINALMRSYGVEDVTAKMINKI